MEGKVLWWKLIKLFLFLPGRWILSTSTHRIVAFCSRMRPVSTGPNRIWRRLSANFVSFRTFLLSHRLRRRIGRLNVHEWSVNEESLQGVYGVASPWWPNESILLAPHDLCLLAKMKKGSRGLMVPLVGPSPPRFPTSSLCTVMLSLYCFGKEMPLTP